MQAKKHSVRLNNSDLPSFMVSQPLFASLHNHYALTGSTGGEVSLMSERGGWITGGCISCSAGFSLLFSGFVGLNRGLRATWVAWIMIMLELY